MKTFTVETDDNVELGGRTFGSPDGQPLLLVHGLGTSHLSFLPGSDVGLVDYLKQNGFKVHALDLRGRGMSEDVEGMSFSHFRRFDIPDAIEQISNHEQQPITYMGHSMGGILYYALVAEQPEYQERIASAVTLGSSLDWPRESLPFSYRALRSIIPESVTGLSKTTIQTMLSFGADRLASAPKEFLLPALNTENVDGKLLQQYSDAFEGTSRQLMTQFLDYLVRFYTDSTSAVSEQMTQLNLTSPTMAVVAAGDRLVPPSRLEWAARHIPSLSEQNLQLKPLGEDSGHRIEYGHLDFMGGSHTEHEVFPAVEKFLDHHEQERQKRPEAELTPVAP